MKKITFFSLYFSEGAPIGFIWWALPAILTKQGMNVTQTASISAIATLPWTFKFILAPLVDLITMNLLSLKKQLLFYQLLMGAALYFLIPAIKSSMPSTIIGVLLCHGLFAALQDICIDALAIRNIPTKLIGKMNGIMQTGMLLGRSIFGGAGVYLTYQFGLSIMIYFLISSVWISLIILQKTKFPNHEVFKVSARKYLHDFFYLIKNKKFWYLIGIAYFAGYSYNGISTVSSAVLSNYGATPLIHGLTYSLFLPISMAIGALFGGQISDKYSSRLILERSLLLSIITSIVVGLVIDYSTSLNILILSYIIFYLFIGSSTSTLYGFLMKNTSKEFAALEFSIFMGIVNFCDSSTSFLTGQLLTIMDYSFSTSIIGIICLISIILIRIHEKTQQS
jgi:MFS family permease